METNIKEKQNKIVLRLMIVSLVVIIIATILVIVLFGVNVFDTNLSLTGKFFLNMAIILTSALVILPGFYHYFDKILRLLEIANDLEKRLHNLSELVKEASKIKIEALDIKLDTKKLIAKSKKEIADIAKEIRVDAEKRTISKMEKIWQERWEKKFAKLKKLEEKYKS